MICDVHGVEGCGSKGCEIWKGKMFLGFPVIEVDDPPKIRDGDIVPRSLCLLDGYTEEEL
jgi:hypothetical protein